jgi:hypothetical protein
MLRVLLLLSAPLLSAAPSATEKCTQRCSDEMTTCSTGCSTNQTCHQTCEKKEQRCAEQCGRQLAKQEAEQPKEVLLCPGKPKPRPCPPGEQARMKRVLADGERKGLICRGPSGELVDCPKKERARKR